MFFHTFAQTSVSPKNLCVAMFLRDITKKWSTKDKSRLKEPVRYGICFILDFKQIHERGFERKKYAIEWTKSYPKLFDKYDCPTSFINICS